jgi:hypothetical protein
MGEGQSSDRVILKPRRSSEVPLSNFGIELPEKREEVTFKLKLQDGVF